jgi:methylmalonyl-CoA mutase N-terminal domain/subunit
VAEEKIEPYRERIDRIQAYKDSRDPGEIREVLGHLRLEAEMRGKDLMHPILEAWKAGATMGEIGGMLRMAYDFPYDPHGFLDPPV